MGEFLDNLITIFCKNLYDGLYQVANMQFQGMFESLNNNIASSAAYITQTPDNWSHNAFLFVRNIAENVCIPLAGYIIAFVFCLEVIHIVQENNQMNNITPERMLIILLKFALFIFLASKSFDIVMGVYEIGSWASARINGIGAAPLSVPDLSTIISEPERYFFDSVFEMLINLILIFAARIVVFALAVAIFIKVNLWYLELLMYTSIAPIPMSTFMNKEWGQIGQNYTRKIIAVCFEGFFMLVAFGLYSALLTNLVVSGEEDFVYKLFMAIGSGIALFIMLCKSGNISASVFNAH